MKLQVLDCTFRDGGYYNKWDFNPVLVRKYLSTIHNAGVEYNEYLRILENGYTIQGVLVDSDAISVDSKDDLEIVRKKMSLDKIYSRYSKIQ